MNQFNPAKLLHSKWTAIKPRNKEKHFLIVEVEFDQEGVVIYCILQAVINKRKFPINWLDLKNSDNWRQGWEY